MSVLPVLNTIFTGLGALAAVAGAFIAFAALRISMKSREKADAAATAAGEASASDRRTRSAVADALDDLARAGEPTPPTVAPSTGAVPLPSAQRVRLSEIAGRLRRGE